MQLGWFQLQKLEDGKDGLGRMPLVCAGPREARRQLHFDGLYGLDLWQYSLSHMVQWQVHFLDLQEERFLKFVILSKVNLDC